MFAENPIVHDTRLKLTLFASDPEIVTPVGMAIDRNDRVFVIESHTHTPPSGYKGPKHDLIKVFVDSDRDGKPDRTAIFAEGIREAMNLAFSPDGVLHVVCAREVWALPDSNGDGICDENERRRVLHVETSNLYPHSCLLALTFSSDGWLYVSRGNNGSAGYTIHGTGGAKLSGYGDGGNVFRCRPDGSNLQEFATGFWNPFDLKFDHAGRLLLVDNDPDARGPNRFLHIVPHGDYGYKSIYGGGGNHPFQGWDGDLPGTLPMIDGTGEAPSGLLDCARAALPADYNRNYLVTIWNENSIARYSTKPRGVSLTATHSNIVTGGRDFRPVALDADSRGDIYVTDWVLVDYPNHGRGRIWKLIPRSPHSKPTNITPNEAMREFDALLSKSSPGGFSVLESALGNTDPFIRHAAVVALSQPVFHSRLLEATASDKASVRLGALLALRRGGYSRPQPILRRALADSQADVCRAAMMWIGEELLTDMRNDIDVVLSRPRLSAPLFEAWLATVQNLDPQFVADYRSQSKDKAAQITRPLKPAVIDGIIRDETKSTAVRALALTRLSNPSSESNQKLLSEFARTAEAPLSLEAIRTLAQTSGRAAFTVLTEVALNPASSVSTAAEALVALGWSQELDLSPFIPLLDHPNMAVRVETARLLGRDAANEKTRDLLVGRLDRARADSAQLAVAQQLDLALHPAGMEPRTFARPGSVEEWKRAVAAGGDIKSGERLFHSSGAGCVRCHTIQNRGARLGPDLSNIGQSLSREQLIHSVIRPSDQYAPQWQAWFVETKGDQVHEGLQLDHKDRGDIELFTTAGRTQHFKAKDIANYGVRQNSLMPDGLENAMTIEDFRNLIAFLDSLK